MNNMGIYKPKALNCERSQEWNLELARSVQKVAEVTRCVIEGAEEISCINEAIAVGDKEQMWNLLQQKQFLRWCHVHIVPPYRTMQ